MSQIQLDTNRFNIMNTKGRLQATIFKSADPVRLIWLCYSDDAVRCIVSDYMKMVAKNHPLIRTIKYSLMFNG